MIKKTTHNQFNQVRYTSPVNCSCKTDHHNDANTAGRKDKVEDTCTCMRSRKTDYVCYVLKSDVMRRLPSAKSLQRQQYDIKYRHVYFAFTCKFK